MRKLRKVRRIKKIKSIRRKKKFKITKYTVGSSKIEKQFGQFLKNLGLDVESQHQILYKFFDFHIKGKKVLVELDGDYFHCNPRKYPNGPINKMQQESIKNDQYKTALAEAHGYKLIRIWEYDFRNDQKGVIEKLKLKGLIK